MGSFRCVLSCQCLPFGQHEPHRHNDKGCHRKRTTAEHDGRPTSSSCEHSAIAGIPNPRTRRRVSCHSMAGEALQPGPGDLCPPPPPRRRRQADPLSSHTLLYSHTVVLLVSICRQRRLSTKTIHPIRTYLSSSIARKWRDCEALGQLPSFSPCLSSSSSSLVVVLELGLLLLVLLLLMTLLLLSVCVRTLSLYLSGSLSLWRSLSLCLPTDRDLVHDCVPWQCSCV